MLRWLIHSIFKGADNAVGRGERNHVRCTADTAVSSYKTALSHHL
ncbi:hypothetical protein [Moraxella cuniculi]|nr:hypothetical protein [Moraxella cuniculi]